MVRMNMNIYPPISHYGFIADCHSSALVSNSGSIDWCCMPRIDSGSCFGRILDWKKGGYCQIIPSSPYETSRRYLEDTLVLETTFRTRHGEARLLDCFTMREGGKHEPSPADSEGDRGYQGQGQSSLSRSYLASIMARPRPGFDVTKRITTSRSEGTTASSSPVIFICKMMDRHSLSGSCTVKAGQRAHLSILYRRPEDLDEDRVEVPAIEELDRRLDETVAWWRSWSSKGTIKGPYAGNARRSAIVLKGLSNAPTGAIAAASTTSLPESPGGSRNWDYRYTWIRDSSFTVRSLAEVGHVNEADGFRRFIERTAAGSAEDLQILFGVGGERRLYEHEIKELEGYRRIKPVRVGNAAAGQRQLDVYGELLDLDLVLAQPGPLPG